jgi:phage gpG-like protein
MQVERERLMARLVSLHRRLGPNSPEMRAALYSASFTVANAIKLKILEWKTQRQHLIDEGILLNSITPELTYNGFRVYTNCRYAHVHEFGTIGKGGLLPDIKPHNPPYYLTIPLQPKYKKRRATDFDLYFARNEEGRAMLFEKDTDEPAYLLLRKVSIPARPYFFPPIRGAVPEIIEKLKQVIEEN